MIGEIPFNVVCHEGSYMTPNHHENDTGRNMDIFFEAGLQRRVLVTCGKTGGQLQLCIRAPTACGTADQDRSTVCAANGMGGESVILLRGHRVCSGPDPTPHRQKNQPPTSPHRGANDHT